MLRAHGSGKDLGVPARWKRERVLVQTERLVRVSPRMVVHGMVATRIFKRRRMGLIVLLALGAGCAPAFEKEFPEEYQNYVSQPEQKALAYVQDIQGGYAYGFGFGMATEQEAIARALEECNVRQQLYQVAGTCKIYMINDRKVAD